MRAGPRMRGVVPKLRLAASDVTTLSADPEVHGAAALLTGVGRRLGNHPAEVSALFRLGRCTHWSQPIALKGAGL